MNTMSAHPENDNTDKVRTIKHRKTRLMGYDLLILAVCFPLVMLLTTPNSAMPVPLWGIVFQFTLLAVCILAARILGHVYAQVWRYSRTNSFLRLMVMDVLAAVLYVVLASIIPVPRVRFLQISAVCLLNLFGCVFIRYVYTYLCQLEYGNSILKRFFGKDNAISRLMIRAVRLLTGVDLSEHASEHSHLARNKIRIAIVGAGRIGTMLAEELLSNTAAVYTPVCFVDVDKEKVGREIDGIRVLDENEATGECLSKMMVQEIVFAVSKEEDEQKLLYDKYKTMGFKCKVYTLPVGNSNTDGRRQIREFEVEELLFRSQVEYLSQDTRNYYHNKVVLVSGGGGSIGSELSRQIARMQPKQLILLDIYENNVYDVQQEMRLLYGDKLNLAVEIASVRDVKQLDKVFRTYHPDVVLHAAAHKHVPLMEHNCSEAVKNNVFGTWNMVNVSEKYGVKKFVMISTDKAVNPTNVMGATKRLCEMIVLSRGSETAKRGSGTKFSCTRFGNVLGSNGSVIPLFKRQIANGGPVTLTDRRIIRYFMTIPEASQLVLTSGAIAKNGELFVLDMGRPVKILDLAENMIRLSGMEPYKDIDIVETGLRPGEKLFEELLIKTENLDKTDNSMIFVERDEPISRDEVDAKLAELEEALATEDDDLIRKAMKHVVPTFHSAEHTNRNALRDGTYENEAKGEHGNAAAS